MTYTDRNIRIFALSWLESDERFPDTLDCLQRFYDVPSKTIRKDFSALKYLKKIEYEQYKNRKEKYESLYGQNIVEIIERPQLLEPGSEQEFEEPEGSEFKYDFNSTEFKAKLAKGNFTHILSSPQNLTCKGYETCYEVSITYNQLCLPTFNYKGIGEIPEAGMQRDSSKNFRPRTWAPRDNRLFLT